MYSNTAFRRRQWHPTPVLLPGKSHGWTSLVGCSPWGRGESDTTERLHFHFSLSCTGEGNGNPLQCSCLEHPRDWGAWWAAVSGVAQSQTRLKRLSSSSNIAFLIFHMRMWTVKGVQKDDQCPVQTHTEVLLASLPARTTGPPVRTMLPHAHATRPWQGILPFTHSFITAPCCPALFLLYCCRLFHRLR